MSPDDLAAIIADANRIHADLHAFVERLALAPPGNNVLWAIGMTRDETRARAGRDLMRQVLCGLRASSLLLRTTVPSEAR